MQTNKYLRKLPKFNYWPTLVAIIIIALPNQSSSWPRPNKKDTGSSVSIPIWVNS